MRYSLSVIAGVLSGFIAVRAWLRDDRHNAAEHAPGAQLIEPRARSGSSLAGAFVEDREDGLTSDTTVDRDGDDLDGSRHYSITGPLDMPAAWWSITLYDRDWALIPNSDERHAFTSFNVIPEDDGGFLIDVAPERPVGAMNWLPCGRDAPFSVCVRLYRSDPSGLGRPDMTKLVQIAKVNDRWTVQ